jgi:hypothetical protein
LSINIPIMKFPAILLAAAVSAAAVSCDKPAANSPAAGTPATAPPAPVVDPKAAFTDSLNALADEVNGLEAKYKNSNPMEILKELPGVLAKLQLVSTEGLPEDVAAAFKKLQANSSRMGEIIATFPKDLPSDPAKMGEYMQANPEAMNAMMAAGPKMETLKADGDIAKKELEEAAAKNGMDLTKFIKAGENAAAETPPAETPATTPAE